jgi:fructokinase
MILVCGEALIDLFMTSDVSSGPILKGVAGGSPLNVAIGLARLGTPAAFFGGLSVDYFGTMLADTLRREGVDISLVKRNARPTPLVLVSADAQGHPSYTFYAHESAVQDLGLADVAGPLPPSVGAIAFGSYALAVEPVGTALLALAEREAERTVIALDCNLRPAMVGSLYSWRERIERFACCASIIKLSDEDFASGWSEGAQSDDQAARWLELGVKLVILTQGARGATAWHRSGRVTVPAPPVTVFDTVGAGDSFQAAVLARLARKGLLSSLGLANLDRTSIADVLRYANLAAGMTCGRRGADLPRRVELETLIGEY